MATDLLFVYGTLLSSFDGYYARKLHDSADLLGPATVQGKLYDLGCFPGFIRSGGDDSVVHGEIYHLQTPEETLEDMDIYEGVGSGLYQRISQVATTPDGEHHFVWIYEFVGKSTHPYTHITDGDYRAYITHIPKEATA